MGYLPLVLQGLQILGVGFGAFAITYSQTHNFWSAAAAAAAVAGVHATPSTALSSLLPQATGLAQSASDLAKKS